MSTRVLVIRHGESVANCEKFFAGQNNIPLTDLGIKQAEVAAEAMKDIKIDKVFSSTLDRAYYTALPFAKMRGLEVERIHDFIERDCGFWTGKTFEEVERLYPEERMLWREQSFDLTISGAKESTQDSIRRIGNAVDTLAKENENLTVLVASHGGVIKALPYYFSENKSAELYNKTPVPTNCSITEIVYENGVGRLLRYSDDNYLKDLKSGAFII